MLKHRVIPTLLLSNEGLVKTSRFRNPKYIGDPTNAIRIFNDKEVDELIVLDITASKLNHEPNYEVIKLFAGECFMPLCYGGGIRSVDQAARIFDLGVEKISLQSAALEDLPLVSKIADRFGSQSVVISLDLKRNWLNRLCLYSSRRNKLLKFDWLNFAQQAEAAGAGEILVNAVDKDGMMNGYDIDLVQQVVSSVRVPVIALGGAGKLEDFTKATQAGASAVAAGAMFVFHGPHRAVLITYPNYTKLEELFEK